MEMLVKITEIVNGIYCFSATIRAKRGKSSTNVKTIVFADGISQARALLGAMYGDENVVSVSPITDNQMNETIPSREKSVVPRVPRVLPTEYAHDLAKKALLNQMKRNSLQVKPSLDDLKAARSDFEAEQKRVNREYDKWVEDKLKWAEIRKRNL
jgi:hypothetical protein